MSILQEDRLDGISRAGALPEYACPTHMTVKHGFLGWGDKTRLFVKYIYTAKVILLMGEVIMRVPHT